MSPRLADAIRAAEAVACVGWAVVVVWLVLAEVLR